MRTPRDIFQPFKVALNGIIFTFKTQRHMRFHLYVVFTIVLLGMFVNLGLREMLVLLFTVSLVVVAEMFNSAIEAVVDMVSPNYSPNAKFAKDIAAGAVLITTIIALVVGALLILGENRWETLRVNLSSETPVIGGPLRIIIGIFLCLLAVIIGKGLGKRGQVLQGGLVSGHATLGFFFATCAVLMTPNALVGGLAVLLAAIIAQSRYEAKFHSLGELAIGAAVGVVIGLMLFGTLPR
ncbi:MAG TPA: diacylglycerol kinase [Fimbriimonas sp.]|nr:diacylglycerol kinase [Fimbriimonas sp.]